MDQEFKTEVRLERKAQVIDAKGQHCSSVTADAKM
jgi:hypothetical protein